MTRVTDLGDTIGVQKVLLATGTILFLGGLLVVTGFAGPSVGGLGSDPAASGIDPPVDTATPNQRQTATPAEPRDTPAETEREPSTAEQALTLNGATKLELTGKMIRTAVSVAGPLSERLHVTGRTVIQGRLGLSEVVADVTIEDNAHITGRVEADRIGEGAGVSLRDGARVGGISVGTVTDGDLRLKDHTTVDGGITVAAIEPDGEVKLDGSPAVGDDVRLGQVDGAVTVAGETVVDGDLVIDRIGSDGELTLGEYVQVRGNVTIREVDDDDGIDIDEDAVAGDIVIEGNRESSEDDWG